MALIYKVSNGAQWHNVPVYLSHMLQSVFCIVLCAAYSGDLIAVSTLVGGTDLPANWLLGLAMTTADKLLCGD